jgi:hypothetical protein
MQRRVDEWRSLRSLLVGGHVLRRVRKQRRNSSANRSGTSSDAKCPPRSSSFQYKNNYRRGLDGTFAALADLTRCAILFGHSIHCR